MTPPNLSSALVVVLLLLLSQPTTPTTAPPFTSLQPSQSLSPNDTLLSGDGTITLGFFPPTSKTYLGLWYSNLPTSISHPFWVANRDRPILSPPGNLTLSSSSLTLTDSHGTTLWSSASTDVITSASLDSSGNLAIHAAGSTPWQTADHPSDTILPGTVLRSNLASTNTTTLVSWANDLDPSPGNLTFGIDAKNSAQFIMRRGGERYWRSHVWGGTTSFGITMGNYILYLTPRQAGQWCNVSFGFSQSSVTLNVRLNYTGRLEMLVWNQGSKSNGWSVSYYFPASTCEVYGYCGSFGVCNTTLQPPTCQCLDGFVPKTASDWNEGRYSGGCVRKSQFTCDAERDEFIMFGSMKLPDGFVFDANLDESACMDTCLGNCSCTAYSYSDPNKTSSSLTVTPTGSKRCFMWTGELIDMLQENSTGVGDDLYLRVPSSHRANSKTIIVVVAALGVIVFTALVCVIWRCKKKREKHRREGNNQDEGDMSGAEVFNLQAQHGKPDLPSLEFGVLVSATDNFSDSFKIGHGGFGNVYKGTLPGGQEVAIKRLSKGSGQGLEEFKNEVTLIAQLQHRNLVRLLGCCVKGAERLLVYEYMPNKSLDFFLFGAIEKQMLLDWERRFIIIKGIARGLRYLHEDSRMTIIHRDLKAANVLLDGDMNPRISDFGMARMFGGNQDQANTLRIAGTYGYMSPEYAMEGIFSVKSDVYSFGVLLLEIISGQRNTGFGYNQKYSSLVSCAWETWSSENLVDLIDPSLGDSFARNEVSRCVHIGLLCVQDRTKDRPTMSNVVFMLENTSPIDAVPKKPTFTPRIRVAESSSSGQNADAASLNSVTLTAVQCR